MGDTNKTDIAKHLETAMPGCSVREVLVEQKALSPAQVPESAAQWR